MKSFISLLSLALVADGVAARLEERESNQTPAFDAVLQPAQQMHRNASGVGKKELFGRDLLIGRQSCPSGYGYCNDATGGCCELDMECCEYDYCMYPGKACCPGGSCPAGWGCCGSDTCYPLDGECCSDGNYCEAGNICVIYDGGHVCCTDLSCTAYVEGGATSYYSTANAPSSTTIDVGTTISTATSFTITQPPAEPTVVAGRYYYWTITWYYISYYYTLYIAETTITYTTITRTTTLSVSATNAADASAQFSSLSTTLILPTPADATSLSDAYASVATAVPSASSQSFDFGETTRSTTRSSPSTTRRSSSSSRRTGAAATATSGPAEFTGGAGGLVAKVVVLGVGVVVPGLLMVWR